MLRFISFKSKQFIFLISLYSKSIKTKRYLSQLQTKVNTNNDCVEYSIHHKIHREEKELNRILPASIKSDGAQFWYKNGKRHRNERDEKGRVLPSIVWNSGGQAWYKNGKEHRDDRDENGKILPSTEFSWGTRSWCENGILLEHREMVPT